MDGGDSSTTVWMCLKPLNYTLKTSWDGKFYVMCTLPQFFRKNLMCSLQGIASHTKTWVFNFVKLYKQQILEKVPAREIS